MSFMSLEQQGSVFVLTLTNGEAGNVLNDAVLDEFHQVFDQIAAHQGDTALVITSNDPKTFSNGIDLPWLMQTGDLMGFVTRMENMLIRLSLLNVPVIAAINGNAYAGGALLASVCDFRLMRADKGRFCYSEVKVKMAFTPALLDIVRLLPNSGAGFELALTGNAWGGEECARREVVNQALPADALLPAAIQLAQDLATRDRATYAAIKKGLKPAMARLAKERGLKA
jgi:Delta3-Delta2-enoyl-CoA isomerase